MKEKEILISKSQFFAYFQNRINEKWSVSDIIDFKFLLHVYISNREHLTYLYWCNNHLRYLIFFYFSTKAWVKNNVENNIIVFHLQSQMYKFIFTRGRSCFSWLRTVTTPPSLPVSPTYGGIRRRTRGTCLTIASKMCLCLLPWTYRTSRHHTAGSVSCLCLWSRAYRTSHYRTAGIIWMLL